MLKGQKMTLEQRKQLSSVRKGMKFSEEHKKNIGKNNARFWDGKNLPEETRKKLSENHNIKSNPKKLEETKRKISLSLKRAYKEGRHKKEMKGKPSWNKGLKGYLSGEKHYAWKGGIGTEREKAMKKLDYVLWRTAVFVRDDYTCQLCNIKGGELQADHIKPWALYPELRYSINNGRTLCVGCHRQTDTWGRRAIYRKDGD